VTAATAATDRAFRLAEGPLWDERRQLSPDGEVVDRIAVSAPQTSSVAFAGPDLDVLVIDVQRS